MIYNQMPYQQQFAGNLTGMQMNNGGYPYGYPPNYPQNQMMNQQGAYQPQQQDPRFQMPIPGVTAPLEVTMKDGSSFTIPPTNGNASVHNPSGISVNPGGYNPVTKTIAQPSAGPGFSPFQQFPCYPGYSREMYPNMQQQQTQNQGIYPWYPGCPQDVANQQQQFIGNPMYGYDRPNYSPFFGSNAPNYYGYGGYGYYGQNQFNAMVQGYLYEQEPSVVDTRSMLDQIILTDEERQRINHNSQIATDYYGRPIYNNGNYMNQGPSLRQQLDESRLAWQKHFTMLSRIAHAYSGEVIDENSAMEFFDPIPKQAANQQQKMYNFYNPTPEEKKEYERQKTLQATYEAVGQINKAKQMEEMLNYQKQLAFSQIKASHDRLIGVEPGQHYDLKTYLDNGYKIGVNAAMREAKSALRNATNKYSTNEYRAGLSQVSGRPVQINSKDDEYVSVEDIIKSMYDRNRSKIPSLGVVKDPGSNSVKYANCPEFGSEMEAHQYFLQTVQKMYDTDKVRRAVTSYG